MPGLFAFIRFSFVLIFSALSSLALQAQIYQFRNYGLEQGLPHRWVYTINQDPSGYLWLGTGTDLARFNGFEFESNPTGDSLPSDLIYSSFHDSKNRIWFGYDDGSITVLENNKISNVENAGLSSRITSIAEDSRGNILIASQQNGMQVVDNSGNIILWQDSFKFTTITAMAPGSDGELLIGTFEGLFIYNYAEGGEPELTGAVPGFPPVTVDVIRNFGEKGVFAGTREMGLFLLQAGTGEEYTIVRPGSQSLLGSARVQSVYLDKRDNIWVSTWGLGIFKISNYFNSAKNHEVSRISMANGLAANHVYGVFQDKEENYWFNTFDGLSLLIDETFSFFPSFGEPFGKNIFAVHSDNNNIWLGGESGLLQIGKNFEGAQFHGSSRGLPFDKVTALTSCNSGYLWIGTENYGIYRLTPGGDKAEPFHQSANSLENSINDLNCRDNVLIAATSNGVIEFNLATGEIKNYRTDEGLTHNHIRSIFTDNENNDWVSTRGNRLTDIMNNNAINTGVELEFIAVTQDNNGNIWAATGRNGIIKMASDTIIQISSSEGLHSDFCYSLTTGSDGDIWVGHRLGLSRIDPETYFVRTYGTEYSIRGDVNFNSVHKTSEGTLLFGTTEGLVSYNVSNEKRFYSPPLLNVTSLLISDEDYGSLSGVSLPYGSYKVRIEFIGLNYADPGKVMYQYKLDGYDLDWSDPSPQRFAYYPRLDDGNFTFLVRAYSAEGVFTETPMSLSISIEKPFWKKWYFYLIVISLTILLVYMIIKIRERNLRLEKERIEIELEIRTREVVEQKAEIEHKNKDITDSINYAQRIQTSILPPVSKIEDNFNESFVFYQPRDIVSGDFYWFDKTAENKFLIVCADSTGHGVPGAFMSMIGTTLIKDICMREDVNSPSEVLETLDREITSTLNQNNLGKSTDGMDITVCEFDLKTHYLRFSSAMRPIMILHNGEMLYLRGSRSSIGGYINEEKEFENHGHQLQPGDIVYLFSDGYTDQFGGPLGKKYKIVRLKNLLTDICMKPMKEQQEHISNNFNLWKGDFEQVDDVLFMGIKI
jgi:ligand-binding sensor domain-containing protein/serine phosphatase RsbU (regulator of sigma subunit)